MSIQIKEDNKRLDCYDSFFLNKDNISVINEDIIAEKEKSEEIATQEYEEKNFGLPVKLRQKEQAELKIVSKIESVSQRLNLQLIIILENGQIWQSVEKIRDIIINITGTFGPNFSTNLPKSVIFANSILINLLPKLEPKAK